VADIFVLSVRQLAGRWRVLVMLALGALPVLNAVAAAALADDLEASQIDGVLINGMLTGAIMPLIVLAVATAAFANEVEDRTLGNLTLTPLPRWRIVAPKLLASIAVSAPIPIVSGVISLSVMMSAAGGENAGRAAFALGAGILAGVTLYSAVFVWAGLLSTRALGFGLLYVFLWEGLFSSFVNGIRFLSIRQYVIAIIHGIDETRFPNTVNMLSLPVAAVLAAVVFGLFGALAVRRLRGMDVP
jgi:ABC-2 type transport system permease protein